MEFINEFDESLASRVRFLPFVPSPFENQQRISGMCNAVLDTPIYNGVYISHVPQPTCSGSCCLFVCCGVLFVATTC